MRCSTRPASHALSARSLVRNIAEGCLQVSCTTGKRRPSGRCYQMGITFNVYGEEAGTEKIFPFDLVPRIVAASEWGPH